MKQKLVCFGLHVVSRGLVFTRTLSMLRENERRPKPLKDHCDITCKGERFR